MSKLPEHMDDFFDTSLVKIAEYVSESFYKTKHTPNILTTYSMISGILSVYFLSKSKYYLFIGLWWLSYFFDTFDGYFARKYSMVSKFGDLYDHIKDISVFVLLMGIVCSTRKITTKDIMILITGIILMNIHLGCQQRYTSTDDGDVLDSLKMMCPDLKLLKYSSYFGPGTFNILLPLYITTLKK